MLASRSSSLNIPPVPVVCVPVLHIPRRSLSLVLVLLALVLVQRPVVALQNVTFQDTSSFLQYSPEVCDGTTTNTSAAQGGGVVQSCIGAWTTINQVNASNGTVTTTSGPSSAFGFILPQLFFSFRGLAVYVKTSSLSNATANLTIVSQPSGNIQSHIFSPSSDFWSFTSLDANQTSTLTLTFGAGQTNSSEDSVKLDIDFVKISVEDASQSSSFLPSQTGVISSGSQPSSPQTMTITSTAPPSASSSLIPVTSTTRTSRAGAIIAASIAGVALVLGIILGVLFWRYRVKLVRRRAVERVERMQERQSRIAVRMLGYDDGDGDGGRGPYGGMVFNPDALESGALTDPASGRLLGATFGPFREPTRGLDREDQMPVPVRPKRFSHGISTFDTTAAEADDMSESRSNMAAISHGTDWDRDRSHSPPVHTSDTQSQRQNIDSELNSPVSPGNIAAPDTNPSLSAIGVIGVATDEKMRAQERRWYSSTTTNHNPQLDTTLKKNSITPGAISVIDTNVQRNSIATTNGNGKGNVGVQLTADGRPKLTLTLPGSISPSPATFGHPSRDTDTEPETEDGRTYWRAI